MCNQQASPGCGGGCKGVGRCRRSVDYVCVCPVCLTGFPFFVYSLYVNHCSTCNLFIKHFALYLARAERPYGGEIGEERVGGDKPCALCGVCGVF